MRHAIPTAVRPQDAVCVGFAPINHNFSFKMKAIDKKFNENAKTNLDLRAFAHYRGHCIPRICKEAHRCWSYFIQCAALFCDVWAVVMQNTFV